MTDKNLSNFEVGTQRIDFERIILLATKGIRICYGCPKPFKPKNLRVKYCSKECKKRARNRRKKESKRRRNAKSCEFCGFSDFRALHLHHISCKKKLGVMVLCANHHSIYHYLVGENGESECKSRQEVLAILYGR